MRFDKLDHASSSRRSPMPRAWPSGSDNQYIEPVHLLAAAARAGMDGSARWRCSSARPARGVNVQALKRRR
jgi:hypothetical protein